MLTENQYYNKFVYDIDFFAQKNIVLDSILGHGNTLINMHKVYPGAHFVEFYFSGTEKVYWNGLEKP